MSNMYKNEVCLNMYDNPPDSDCRLGRLAEICQIRVSIYDRIQKYMDESRMKSDEDESNEESKKTNYQNGMVDCLFVKNYGPQLNDSEDLASHWTLKLALANEKKGDFVMYES